MAQETVIIDVNINQADALTRAKELNNQIIVLRDNQDKLRASGNQLGTTYKNNAQEIRKLESEVNAYIKLSKNEEGSINSLRAQITVLTNQYNALSKAERENGVAGKALTKQLKDLTDQERAASQAGGNFKTSIGNYADALKGATQNMLPFGSEISRAFAAVNSLSGAFKGATGSVEAFKIALLSTGIGALVVVVGSLVAYMKDLDTVTDGATQAISGFKASIGELGRSIFNLDFKGLVDRMRNVGLTAMYITDQQQTLEDRMLAQSVKSSEAQQKIAQLRVQAMNRTLDPAERQRLLAEAEKIDAEDLAKKAANSAEEIRLAQQSIILTGNLNKQQISALKKQGVDYALELQNNLTRQGKVTDDQTKRLAAALRERDSIQSEYTQRSEKRYNLADRIATQADAKEKLRQDAIDKINDDRAKSELMTAQNILTIRNKELIDINSDIDKRKAMYEKYGQDTVQLEVERETRLRTLKDKFAKEDLAIIQRNVREAQLADVRSGANTFGTGNVQQQLSSLGDVFQIQDIDTQIAEVKKRIENGEKGLEEVLQSFVNNRSAIIRTGLQRDADYENQLSIERTQQRSDANLEVMQMEQETFNQQVENHNARLQLNAQLASSYGELFGTISGLFAQNSTGAKVAFAIQQGFAIAQVIINSELEKSAIRLSYANQAAQASLIPVAGPFIAAGLIAAGEVLAAEVTAKEVISVGIIAGTAIGKVVSKAEGGLITGPGSGTSDSIPARLSNGEFVMTAKATQMFAPLLSDMNVAGGGVPYATGGLAGSYVPNISQGINSDNAIARAIGGSLRGQKIYVAVEDIRYADKKYVEVQDYGNY